MHKCLHHFLHISQVGNFDFPSWKRVIQALPAETITQWLKKPYKMVEELEKNLNYMDLAALNLGNMMRF